MILQWMGAASRSPTRLTMIEWNHRGGAAGFGKCFGQPANSGVDRPNIPYDRDRSRRASRPSTILDRSRQASAPFGGPSRSLSRTVAMRQRSNRALRLTSAMPFALALALALVATSPFDGRQGLVARRRGPGGARRGPSRRQVGRGRGGDRHQDGRPAVRPRGRRGARNPRPTLRRPGPLRPQGSRARPRRCSRPGSTA